MCPDTPRERMIAFGAKVLVVLALVVLALVSRGAIYSLAERSLWTP